MIRNIFFWLHLSLGVLAGVFIFIMSATGVLLAFERQITQFADRDVRFAPANQTTAPKPTDELLDSVRRAGFGDLTAITLRNEPRAAMQFSIGRNKTIYVDPRTGAVLGASSDRLHDFFMTVERVHRTLGAPLGPQTGPRSIGRSLTGAANLLFCVLIPLGLVLWLPRKWNWNSLRSSLWFRMRQGTKARHWNWHNVFGIWCALPLFVIALTGVVMSYSWANALLFRATGSPLPVLGRIREDLRPHARHPLVKYKPDYDQLIASAKGLDSNWRTITINITPGNATPVQIDTGTGGQPQRRTQYFLSSQSFDFFRKTTFADNSLGQRLRSFVRFGHTGEYFGLPGQFIAALASLGACFLAYTGISLSIRRLAAYRRRTRRDITQESYTNDRLSV